MEVKSEAIINQEHPYNLKKAIEQFERSYLINIPQLRQSDLSPWLGIYRYRPGSHSPLWRHFIKLFDLMDGLKV